jgi:hypothetical protein
MIYIDKTIANAMRTKMRVSAIAGADFLQRMMPF